MFCASCGSSLVWFTNAMPVDLIVSVGTIEEEMLFGKSQQGTIKKPWQGHNFKCRQELLSGSTGSSNEKDSYWQNTILIVTGHLAEPKVLTALCGVEAPWPSTQGTL